MWSTTHETGSTGTSSKAQQRQRYSFVIGAEIVGEANLREEYS